MQQNVPSLYMPNLNVNFSFTEGVGIGNVKGTVVQHLFVVAGQAALH